MKLLKKWIAAALAACLVVSSADIKVQAQSTANAEIQAVQEQKNGEMQSQGQQENGKTVKQQDIRTQNQENQGQQEDIEAQIQEQQTNIGTQNQKTLQAGSLNFIMQELEAVTLPGQQNIAASLGTDGVSIESAQLCYRNQAGQEFLTESAAAAGNLVRFTMEFTEPEQAGCYELVSITYQAEGRNYQVDLAELGMDVKFGVNQEVEAQPDEILMDDEVLQEVEANVVTLDENGKTVSENTLQDVLKEAQAQKDAGVLGRAGILPNAKSMVIMLDPGHDSTHAGARGNGCKEEEAVLKIAQYCKAELQKYARVTVYMTRSSNVCPNGGSIISSSTCNAKRVELAVKKKANVYVSFHLNSSVSATPSGVGVYYPNSNYRPNIGTEGKGLATEIYQKLSQLGLATWAGGTLIHNSEDNTLYPDGSLADYLGVIRRSKEAGIPAVLIEHAFLSNAGDVSGFLNTNAKLKKLGVADASGIASFYGLSKGDNKPEIQWIQSRKNKCLRVSWGKMADTSTYQVYRSTEEDGVYQFLAEVADTEYDDKKAKPGVTYYYKVCGVYTDGEVSDFSEVRSASTLQAPEITNVVSKSGGKLVVRWNGVPNAQEYELVRSESSTGGYSKIATITEGNFSYVDRDVETQKTYYYKLRTRGGDNNGYSNYSKAMSGWALAKTSIVSVASYDNTSLQIQWKKVPNAYAYQIQRSTQKKGTYKRIATVRDGNLSYVDRGLTPQKTYYYKVRVVNKVNNKNGYSGYCGAVSGNTIPSTAISYVKSKSTGNMELKWKKDAAAYAYSIKRSTKKKGPYTKIAEIRNCDITQYVDKNVKGGTRYYYVVETIVDKSGVKHYSGDSKPKSAVNLPKVNIDILQSGSKGITLNWNKVDGANCYQIMRSTKKTSGFSQIGEAEGEEAVNYTDAGVTKGTTYYYRVRAVRKGKHPGYGSYGAVSEISAAKKVK